MSGIELMHDYNRHTRTLPLLTYIEANREANVRGLGSHIEAFTGTRECAVGERA
jgi:hypothetical protein